MKRNGLDYTRIVRTISACPVLDGEEKYFEAPRMDNAVQARFNASILVALLDE